MTIRILIAAVGIALLLGTPAWAQSSTRTFDSLSPGNQKIANALFSAQNTTGTTLTPLTRDQIAGLKGTEGWGRVFKQMKADGLVQAKNLGQVVSAHQHQLNAARRGSGGPAGTASATTIARTNRSGRTRFSQTTMAASMRTHGRVGGGGFAGGRGFAGSSHFGMGHGVAVSTMGSGGFGHGGGMGGGFGGGMGGGFGGGRGGGGGHGR